MSSSETYICMQGSGLMQSFGLQERVVACFLREIEEGYLNNQYHSRIHAAGVLQITHMLVQNGLVQSGILDETMQLACYVAGAVYIEPGH